APTAEAPQKALPATGDGTSRPAAGWAIGAARAAGRSATHGAAARHRAGAARSWSGGSRCPRQRESAGRPAPAAGDDTARAVGPAARAAHRAGHDTAAA